MKTIVKLSGELGPEDATLIPRGLSWKGPGVQIVFSAQRIFLTSNTGSISLSIADLIALAQKLEPEIKPLSMEQVKAMAAQNRQKRMEQFKQTINGKPK